MTREEASIIATFRVHFGCTYSKVASLAKAIWGTEHAMLIAGTNNPGRLGECLIGTMEKTLGLHSCESDDMIMEEGICTNCKHIAWSLCYPSDVGKECSNCGQMTWLISAPEAKL